MALLPFWILQWYLKTVSVNIYMYNASCYFCKIGLWKSYLILAFHRIIHKYTQGSSINLDYFSFYAELCFNTICIHKFPLRFYLLPTFKSSYFMSPHQFLSLFIGWGRGLIWMPLPYFLAGPQLTLKATFLYHRYRWCFYAKLFPLNCQLYKSFFKRISSYKFRGEGLSCPVTTHRSQPSISMLQLNFHTSEWECVIIG